MNFNQLLIPYNKGGTEREQVERTMGTIIDYLLNKKGYPLDIVSAAIFTVFMWLNTGGRFLGDGSYGSPGRELITAIRIKCDELFQLKLESTTYQVFVEQYAAELACYLKPTLKHKFIRWLKYHFLEIWKGLKVIPAWE